MNQNRTTRILVVTDHPEPSTPLIAAMEHRAELGGAQFRVVVPNPAQAEVHLLHPDRHEKAREAEEILHRSLTELERITGSRMIGSVSVRHDPIDAIEEIIFSEPIDEVILSVAAHGLSTRLHQDLPRRLEHYGLPITVVSHEQVG